MFSSFKFCVKKLFVQSIIVVNEYNNATMSKNFSSSTGPKILAMNDLTTIPGAFRKRRRWGRGVGSGRGKTCGFGHQKSRSTPRGFEGGQTPLYKRLPKIGFFNHGRIERQVLNVSTIQEFIDKGRLKVNPSRPLTMRDLLHSGIISKLQDGVKLLSKDATTFKTKIHLEVSDASKKAIAAIEKAGGTVTCVHFNKLALRVLTKPYKFDILPFRARPPPKLMEAYLDRTKCGYLSPEIQIRNLQLFGCITSENRYRDEHANFMKIRRLKFGHHKFGNSDRSNNVKDDEDENVGHIYSATGDRN